MDYIYVVMTQSKQYPGAAKVSQEGYKTLKAAQDFCKSRGKVEKISEYLYEDAVYFYSIYPVGIKE